MRFISIMLLAIVLAGCFVTRDPKQYDGVYVKLIDIQEEWRLVGADYIKRLVYVYEIVGREYETPIRLSYPLNAETTIGTKQIMPIQR